MSKIFTGTATIGEEVYAVSGPLSSNGSRLTGTLNFTDHPGTLIPIGAIIRGEQISTNQIFFFLAPGSVAVKVFPIAGVDTSFNPTFTNISFTADIEIDEEPSSLAVTVSSEETTIETDSFIESQIESINPRAKKKISRVRINEVGNLFDHFGAILSLPRIHGESNSSYATRIRTIPARPRSSTYVGLMNAISNELALSQSESISVKIKDTPVDDKSFIRLVVDGGTIKLYRTWVSEEDQRKGLRPILEQSALLGAEPIKTIGKLVDWINTSENFEATLIADSDLSSEFLMNFDSRKLVKEELKPQDIIPLQYKNVIPGSVLIMNSNNFRREKGIDEELNSVGDYKINYPSGLFYCFSLPSQSIKINYLSSLEEFKLSTSEVKILDLSTKGAQELLFHQVSRKFYETVSESTGNGLPKEEMYRIIRELLTAGNFDQYWGE